MAASVKNNGQSLRHIPLSEIQASQVALRKVDTKKPRYRELVDSVKLVGILNPINVREVKHPETGKIFFSVVDGLHRFTAAADAGLDSIPCQILKLSDAQVHEAQVIANVHKVETRPVEYAKVLERILSDNPLMTIAELASKLGKSPQWLQKTLDLTKIQDSNIVSLVNEGKVKLYNAYALALLPEEEQKNFTDRAMTLSPSEFVPMAKTRAKDIRDAKRKGKTAAPEEFAVFPLIRKKSEINSEMESLTVAKSMVKQFNVKDPVDAWKMALNWTLQLDPKSVEVRKAAEEERKRLKKEESEKAKEERRIKKAKEAAQMLANMS